MPEASGWTKPDWTKMSDKELRSYLEKMQALGETYKEHYEHHHATGEWPDHSDPSDPLWMDAASAAQVRVWRSFPVHGQDQDVSAAEHVQAFQKAQLQFDCHHENVRIHPFIGGLLFEAEYHWKSPDGQEVVFWAAILMLCDAEGRMVRTHEYINSEGPIRMQEIFREMDFAKS